MQSELKFICNRYYLVFWTVIGFALIGLAVFSSFGEYGTVEGCLAIAGFGIFALATIPVESPCLTFSEHTLQINRWIYTATFELHEIESIEGTRIRRASGLMIRFESGKVFRKVCSQRYVDRAIEHIEGRL